MAKGHKSVTVTRRLWDRSGDRIPSGLGDMSYFLLIFSFLRSGTKAKPGVEFRHLTRNVSKNSAVSWKRSVSTLAYHAVCRIQREADFFYLCGN